ncbi:hypothetical protein B0H14DRAFT_2185817, partial [Mycena olivaceomarginata]
DPSVLGRGMHTQMDDLISKPCKLLQEGTHSVLLIDGLDECDGHNVHQEILHLIGAMLDKHCAVLRILLSSRPEPHIREMFQDKSLRRLFDSTNIEQSFNDIRGYLRYEFACIHRKHSTTMRNIPTPWPSSQVLEMLVKKSSGYFIYAATVIKFVD